MDGVRTARGVAGLLVAVAVSAGGCDPGGDVPSPAAPGTTAAPSSSAAPGPGGDAVPESLLLPDEGERSTAAELSDWITDPGIDHAWLLDPCRPTAYPTDRQRTRFRTVTQEGPEAYSGRQLGVYPTAAVATEVLAGFRRVLEACRTGQDANGIRWTWVTRDLPDLGDDGLVAASTHGARQQAAWGERIAVTRVGNAIFLAYDYGEYYTAEFDEGAGAAQQVAQRFLDSL